MRTSERGQNSKVLSFSILHIIDADMYAYRNRNQATKSSVVRWRTNRGQLLDIAGAIAAAGEIYFVRLCDAPRISTALWCA
jgi:hypothetical protein